MAFHFRHNSMFHFPLYFAQSMLHFVFVILVCICNSTFCIQHSTLIYATFKFSLLTFNFDLCNIQLFTFDMQLFISNSQVLEFYLQVQWNVHSFFSHPTLSICPLKEQYPVTVHAPHFDFWTGCPEFKTTREQR